MPGESNIAIVPGMHLGLGEDITKYPMQRSQNLLEEACNRIARVVKQFTE